MHTLRRGKEMLYLTQAEIENLGLSPTEILSRVEAALIEHGHKRYEMPAKIGVHPYQDVFFHAMPAYLPELKLVGAKWIECYPRNPKEFGLPQTTGLLVMNDVETGVPLAVMDCAWLTAMRTPAVTVLMAKKLAPDAVRFGMFGCGVQGRAHVQFANEYLDQLEEIVVYDRYREVAERLVADLQGRTRARLRIGESPEAIAKGCEVLSSATLIVRDPLAIVKREWVGSGQTVLPCDLNTFWDPKIPIEADYYVVDSADEHNLFVEMGYYPTGHPEIMAESGEVLAGLAPGRTSADQLIVNSNIGMAVCDIAVGGAILQRALETGTGTLLAL